MYHCTSDVRRIQFCSMYVYCQTNPVSLVYFAVSYNQLTIDEAMAALFCSQYPKIVLF